MKSSFSHESSIGKFVACWFYSNTFCTPTKLCLFDKQDYCFPQYFEKLINFLIVFIEWRLNTKKKELVYISSSSL